MILGPIARFLKTIYKLMEAKFLKHVHPPCRHHFSDLIRNFSKTSSELVSLVVTVRVTVCVTWVKYSNQLCDFSDIATADRFVR